jgi:hypothetical protein
MCVKGGVGGVLYPFRTNIQLISPIMKKAGPVENPAFSGSVEPLPKSGIGSSASEMVYGM